MVDDDDFPRIFGWFQPQPKLFLKRRELDSPFPPLLPTPHYLFPITCSL